MKKQYRVIEDGIFYTVEEQTFFGKWVKTKHSRLSGWFWTKESAIIHIQEVINKKPQKKVVWESPPIRKI